MCETKKPRCLSYIRKRCVLQRVDKLLRFRVVWNEAGRTISCVGVSPPRGGRCSSAHPRRRGNRRQSRCSARLDKCPGTAYHAAVNMSLHDASRDRGMQNGGVMGGGNVPGKRSSDPGDLLPLTPVALNVLLALADGERHGYGIMLEVRERTGGRVRLGPGTLYGAIKRLKEGGGIEEAGAGAGPGGGREGGAPGAGHALRGDQASEGGRRDRGVWGEARPRRSPGRRAAPLLPPHRLPRRRRAGGARGGARPRAG